MFKTSSSLDLRKLKLKQIDRAAACSCQRARELKKGFAKSFVWLICCCATGGILCCADAMVRRCDLHTQFSLSAPSRVTTITGCGVVSVTIASLNSACSTDCAKLLALAIFCAEMG
jgi:hypothetical protein